MNVSLSPDLEEFINRKVASGRYLSADDVVREALRLLDDREQLRAIRLEELRREIAIGIDEADRGLVAPLDMDAIREKVRKRLEEEQEAQ